MCGKKMKNQARVGIDVDQTIVDTETLWTAWLKENPTKTVDNFFQRAHLYDKINVNSVIITQIEKLSKIADVIFISSCFEEHIESKKQMLDRAFSDFMDVKLFVSKTKYEIPVDYMIDDREKVLNNMPKNTLCLKADLPGVRSEKYPVLSWEEIYDTIKKDINVRT
jgi:5'(3')-deoxyribonucleotidase